MLVQVFVIEPHDGHQPGERYNASERTARMLEARGLVKVGFENKAHDPVKEDKGRRPPFDIAGAAAPQFALPAAQVSPPPTVSASGTGRRRGRPPGKSSQSTRRTR
jgi:hypothetical protein